MSSLEFCADTCGIRMSSTRSKPSLEKAAWRVVRNDARMLTVLRQPHFQLSQLTEALRAIRGKACGQLHSVAFNFV